MLTEQGRRQVHLPAAAVWAVTEAQWRAGKFYAAQDRVFDVDQQPLRPGLLPAVDLVEGAHLAGRDADLVEPGQPGSAAGAGAALLDPAR